MKTTAICHGAATIITAFAAGKGSAFGIDLWTKATAELNDSNKITAEIIGNPDENTNLMKCCARRVLDYFKKDYGVDIKTESNIPIAVGLKSSSTAANASVLAIVGAIARENGQIKEVRLDKNTREQKITIDDKEVTPETLINLGVDAAFDAKVTITGAFDDASASFLGGFTVTDNLKRKILRSGDMESLDVTVLIPKTKKEYSGSFDTKRIKLFEREMSVIWNEALRGNLYTAMTLNGLLHSAVYGHNNEIIINALESGAIAAGLSGTGPAVVALIRDINKIRDSWSQFDGKIIETKTNNERAKILS